MKHTTWVVIPGIGDQKSGETMTTLARSLSTRNHTAIQNQKDCYLIEGEDGGHIQTFKVPMIDASTSNHTIHFNELYWNDLSTVKDSWWGITKGIFKVVTGLRHLVTPTESDKTTQPLAILAQIFFWLLGGPILGGSALVFFMWAILLAVHGGLQLYYKCQEIEWLLNAQLLWLFPLISFLIGISILILPIKLKGQKLRSLWTLKCIAVLSLLLTIIFPVLTQWKPGYFTMISDSIFYAIVVPVIGFWALANVNMLLLFIGTLIQGVRFGFKKNPSIIIPALSTILTMAFLTAAIPVLIVASDTLTTEKLQFDQIDKVIQGSLPTVGWIWIGFVISVIFAVILAVRRGRWFKKSANKVSPSHCPPRLVFSPFMFWVLFALSVPAIATFFMNIARQIEFTNTFNPVNDLTDLLRLIVIVSIPVILPLFGFAKSGIRLGLDLTLDIVNYFKPKPAQGFKAWRTPYATIQFDLRERVFNRLDKIINLSKEGDTPGKLILLTHSQGTIFGLDYISNPKNHGQLAAFNEVVLITIGSPFTHIYQHYFRNYFTQEQRYKAIKTVLRGNSWLNIYCTDDYIGTFINPYQPTDDPTLASPKNIEIGLGGHTGYFTNSLVMDELEKL